MSGRPRIVRSIQSYVNHTDSRSGLSMLKAGTPNKVGVTHYLWHNLQTQSNPGPKNFINRPSYYKTLQWHPAVNRWNLHS